MGKESSRRKETGSPRKGVKGKKRGFNREIVTLGGLKKQEAALRRKLKRKMNQQRGMAGFPAARKDRVTTPLQDSPISVIFINNTILTASASWRCPACDVDLVPGEVPAHEGAELLCLL